MRCAVSWIDHKGAFGSWLEQGIQYGCKVSPMDSSTLMIEITTWVLMIVWLAFVVVSGVLAFRKWQRTEGSVRLQMGYLWIGAAIVCAGDLLHTIGGTISAYTGSTTGSVSVAGTVFEARTFTMFFDALVFIVYYTLWALFIVARYQQGAFKPHDKIVTGLALAAMVLILPGAVPNALGIYTLEYIIAVWAPHITLFIIFGVMTVYKLIRCSRDALARSSGSAHTNAGEGIVPRRSRLCLLVFVFLPFPGTYSRQRYLRNVYDSQNLCLHVCILSFNKGLYCYCP